MVGVNFRHLEEVDIFNLLGLNPSDARVGGLKLLRKAYRRALIVAHPDRTGQNDKAQQLSLLREFLCDFDSCDSRVGPRFDELFRRGWRGWVSNWNPWLNPNDP